LEAIGQVGQASGVVRERLKTSSRIKITSRVLREGTAPGSGVFDSGGVASERPRAGSRVGASGCAGKERLKTVSGVVESGCVGLERIATGGCIVIPGGVFVGAKTGGRVVAGGVTILAAEPITVFSLPLVLLSVQKHPWPLCCRSCR
jgi:hypothetical protein